MAVSLDDVKYVADLARLKFNDEELAALQNDLNNILVYFEKLNELDTSGITPTAHVLEIKNRFREDEVEPSLDREEALSNAPSVKDNCFKVPKIID